MTAQQRPGWPATWPVSVEDVYELDDQPAETETIPVHRPVSRAARIAAGLVLAAIAVCLFIPVLLWFRWAA